MLTPSQRLLRRHTFISDDRRPGWWKRMETEDEGCFAPAEGICGGDKGPRSSSSDAFEQVGVAVVSSAAVAQLPDARPELHGAAVAQTALRQRDQSGIFRQSWSYKHQVCFLPLIWRRSLQFRDHKQILFFNWFIPPDVAPLFKFLLIGVEPWLVWNWAA